MQYIKSVRILRNISCLIGSKNHLHKMTFNVDKEVRQFDGKLLMLSHDSQETKTKMSVNVFLPPQALDKSKSKTPVLVYLSGLTCTPFNATDKSYFQYFAKKYGFALVFPDTSPRGAGIKGEDDSFDLGTGAGLYVDATREPWSKNYRMYSYVHKELLSNIEKEFPTLDVRDRISICGHSMGGLGALGGFLKNPGKYKSVSGFAPISNPLESPFGHKAFDAYLGPDKKAWYEYDPCYLIKNYKSDYQPDILIHVGTNDDFDHSYKLLHQNFAAAAKESDYKGKVDLNIVEGYNHLYYFISSFVEDHAKFHAKYLGLPN